MDKLAKKRMIAIAKDSVKNPAKAFLIGPSLSEAKKILKKFGVKKKMGGGLTEATRRLRAQGLKNGGMCRGMGAAIRGGDFKGVR